MAKRGIWLSVSKVGCEQKTSRPLAGAHGTNSTNGRSSVPHYRGSGNPTPMHQLKKSQQSSNPTRSTPFFRSKTAQPDVALCGSAWSLVFRVAVVAQFLVGAWWLRNMLHAAIPHLWHGKNGHTSVHTNMFMNWTFHLTQKTSNIEHQKIVKFRSRHRIIIIIIFFWLPSFHPRPGRAHSSVQI